MYTNNYISLVNFEIDKPIFLNTKLSRLNCINVFITNEIQFILVFIYF
jgi:hypothetical protein